MPIYKDKKRGTWYYAFTKVVDGTKYSRKKRGFKTKQEATIEEIKAIEELDAPASTKQVYKTYTWDDIYNIYKVYSSTKVKITTLDNYSRWYKNHIAPTFQDKLVNECEPHDIFAWKQELIAKGLSEYFTNKVITLFKKLVQFSLNKEYISNTKLLDELDHVKFNKIPNERQVWSLDEINKFLDTFIKDDATEYSYWLYFYGLAYSGMRPNEYRALTKADIQGDYLVVNKNITSKVKDHGDIIQTPKNANSNRKVLMPHEIIELLNQYTKDHKPSEFIFGKERAFRETNIKRMLDKHTKAAELPHIVVYGFRHSHATNLIRAGVPIKVVSKRLGHKDASTTMNVYWHLFNDDEEQVLDVLNKTKKE